MQSPRATRPRRIPKPSSARRRPLSRCASRKPNAASPPSQDAGRNERQENWVSSPRKRRAGARRRPIVEEMIGRTGLRSTSGRRLGRRSLPNRSERQLETLHTTGAQSPSSSSWPFFAPYMKVPAARAILNQVDWTIVPPARNTQRAGRGRAKLREKEAQQCWPRFQRKARKPSRKGREEIVCGPPTRPRKAEKHRPPRRQGREEPEEFQGGPSAAQRGSPSRRIAQA